MRAAYNRGMWSARRRSLCVLALALAPGCDLLLGMTHQPDLPFDAGADGYVPCEAIDVGMGRGHACAIVPGGDVYCWGLNDEGQVQPGAADRVLVPTKVALPGPAAQLGVGRSTTCARLADQTVWCWGRNDQGELGAGPSTTSPAMVQIQGIGPSAEIAFGGGHACSRSATDGTISCWGRNTFGQTGQATSMACAANMCTLPAAVAGTAGSKKLVAGHNHSCIIDASDHVQCWGRNHIGQLGDGTTTNRVTPTPVTGVGTVISLDTAGHHSCAVDSTHHVWCWGYGDDGEIGDGGYTSTFSPVPLSIVTATSVSVGAFGACAVLADGTATCWGTQDAGDGKPGTYALPHPGTITNITQLVTHYTGACAIATGGVLCWGDNSNGQLGRGERSVQLTLQATNASGATQIVAGTKHTCALTTTGITCWGENEFAQTGDTSSGALKSMPTAVSTPVSGATNLVAAYNKSCAWGGGQAACWGRALSGELGTGSSARATGPTFVIHANIQKVAIGGSHLCIVDGNAAMTCYGSNASGQLGNNSTTDSMTGVSPPLASVSQIAAGVGHTCAVTITGQLYCWGRNSEGEVGDGSTTNRPAPVLVTSVGMTSKVVAGFNFTCSLNTSNELWCWGNNSRGQIGNGTRTTQLTPQKILSNITDVAVGAFGVCATLSDGSVSCWGKNDEGQLGAGADSDLLVPTPIIAFTNASSIALGDLSTCVVQAGQVACVGAKPLLGTGDVSNSIPQPPMLPACR